jgi:hypothetical protein
MREESIKPHESTDTELRQNYMKTQVENVIKTNA